MWWEHYSPRDPAADVLHRVVREYLQTFLAEAARRVRARLERVCRYALRPPVAGARLQLAAEGQVVRQLRHPWADGTTHVAFAPTAFLERLAVLVPRPRVNLVLCHGLLAPRAAWRAEVVPRGALRATADSHVDASASGATRVARRSAERRGPT